MRDVLKVIGVSLVGVLFVAVFIVLPLHLGMKAESRFRDECYSVSGVVVSDDGEIECHVAGREIAELGENSPKQPQVDED